MINEKKEEKDSFFPSNSISLHIHMEEKYHMKIKYIDLMLYKIYNATIWDVIVIFCSIFLMQTLECPIFR